MSKRTQVKSCKRQFGLRPGNKLHFLHDKLDAVSKCAPTDRNREQRLKHLEPNYREARIPCTVNGAGFGETQPAQQKHRYFNSAADAAPNSI